MMAPFLWKRDLERKVHVGSRGDKFSFGHAEFEVKHSNVDVVNTKEIVGSTKFNAILIDCTIRICAVPSSRTLLYWTRP